MALSLILPPVDEPAHATGYLMTQVAHATVSRTDDAFFRAPLEVPAYAEAVYFAPFQKYSHDPKLDIWPDAYNQLHALPVNDFKALKRGGHLLILRLSRGGYLAILPAVSSRSLCWLGSRDERLTLFASHLGTAPYDGPLPLLFWGKGESPHAAVRAAWERALAEKSLGNHGRARWEKAFPEMFNYLGWCSWEAYKFDISEELLLKCREGLRATGLPFRWFIIDDGHLSSETVAQVDANVATGVPGNLAQLKLTKFTPNEKFPRGWKPLMQAYKDQPAQLLGIWLNFNGLWGTLSPRNELGLDEHLMQLADGVVMPGPTQEDADAFYGTMIGTNARAGFDFVKIDNQGANLRWYAHRVPNAVQQTCQNSQAMEEVCQRLKLPLINCMAHSPVNIWGGSHSSVNRCSEDYVANNLWRAKFHLHNSYATMIFLGHLYWGDHDMFHAGDTAAGDIMARSKALSGGPVYLSDEPENIPVEAVKPLCLSDGRLLRPLAPAVALPESVFIDPYTGGQAFRVVAPLAHRCAAVALYNLTHPEMPVRASLRREDYLSATLALPPGEEESFPLPQKLIAFDWISQQAHALGAEGLHWDLPTFGDRLIHLCPVEASWAVIGRADKFLSPAAVESVRAKMETLRVSLVESGPLLVYHEGPVISPDGVVQEVHPHLWRLDLPVRPEAVTVTLNAI